MRILLILPTNSRSPKLTIPEFWKAFLPMLKFVKRGSIGLEYQRANFNLNVNKYFPISDKKVIVNHTEEA
jgi:hypothetical protein